jgi:hypothetical protein
MMEHGTPCTPERFSEDPITNHVQENAMANPTSRNEGEGNRTADRNYREATREFVESERGKEEINKAGEVDPKEAEEIRSAEEEAKARAKEHDPQELRKPNRTS